MLQSASSFTWDRTKSERLRQIEEQSARPFPPADDGDCVRCVPKFRSGLGQVFGPLFDVPARVAERERERGRHESPAALVGISVAHGLDGVSGLLELLLVRRGDSIAVVKGHRLSAGIAA